MLSYTYPFIVFSTSNCWIGCKPALLFYLLYFIISCGYKYKNKINDQSSRKKIAKVQVYAYFSVLLLYFFFPLTGESDSIITKTTGLYLQYEAPLSGIMVIILIFAIGHKLTWQYIRLLDKIVILMTFGSVFSTIIAKQVNSLWIGNLIWFVLLGWMCWQKWSLWENYHPEVDPITTSNGFQPIKSYEQLFPQQKQIANELVDIIHNQNPSEPLSICIAGKWGSGKTSIVNGVVDRLKQKNNYQYEILYIKTMELDTLSSLFTYVFDRIRDI